MHSEFVPSDCSEFILFLDFFGWMLFAGEASEEVSKS